MKLALSIKTLLVSGCCFVLWSCGGSSNSDNSNPSRVPDYSRLKTTSVITTELKQADTSSLSLHIKNGLRLKVRDSARNDYILENGGPSALPSTDDATSGNFSETNTHVEGVDEADYVKYDGSHLFVSTHPQWYWEEQRPEAKIRILATDPAQASAEEVSEIVLSGDDDWGSVSELYLVEDATSNTTGLATLRSTWSYFAWIEPAMTLIDSYFYPGDDQLEVTVYDVADPSDPEQAWQLSIDGYLQDSRKIGNTLYLVMFYSPWLAGLEFLPENNTQKNRNEDVISGASLNDLLPAYSVNGGNPQPLVSAQDCYLPTEVTSLDGFSGLTTLVAIDLGSKQITSSVCLSANVQGIYASLENFYIGATSGEGWWFGNSETVVHKFATGNGDITYRSTGKVPGYLGWDDPAFRMSEHEDYFRIVTTSRDSSGNPSHLLTILEDSPTTDQMLEVATLPNSSRPAAIGKPGEDIYSVRFRDDKAYIVTFQRIDPLYVLDLSNPQDPQIAGELEVPGFSSYLHPINDNYLLGIGNEVTANVQGGVKVSLYDVSDSNNPLEVTSLVLGGNGSSSEAQYNLHAASFLFTSEDQLRFTLPIHTYASGWNWSHSGLHLFEVNGLLNNTATLTHAGEIVAEESTPDQNWPSMYDGARSVMHDEALYFMYGEKIFSAFWSSPQAANGPL